MASRVYGVEGAWRRVFYPSVGPPLPAWRTATLDANLSIVVAVVFVVKK
jgi:hypothetical protein